MRDDSGYTVVAMVAPSDSQQAPEGDRRRWARGVEGPASALARKEGGGEAPEVAVEPRVSTLLLEDDLPAPDEELLTSAGRVVSEPVHELAAKLDINDIVVALEDRRGILPTQELLRCRLRGVLVEEAESFYESVTGKIPAEAMRPSYLIFNRGFVPVARWRCGRQARTRHGCWRSVGIRAHLARRCSSPPSLVRLRLARPGALPPGSAPASYGEPFTLLKFRSMRAGRREERDRPGLGAPKDDPRITRVGRFLRKTSTGRAPPTVQRPLRQPCPWWDRAPSVRPSSKSWPRRSRTTINATS